MDITCTRTLILLFFYNLFNGKDCSGNLVAFFRDTEYTDILLRAEDSMECKTLPSAIKNEVGSVLTDGCTVFFQVVNCQPSKSGIVTVLSGERKNLSEYYLDNEIMSFRRCFTHRKEIQLEIFENSNFTGSLDNFTLSHNECNPVRKTSLGIPFSERSFGGIKALSLKTSGCIIAYYHRSCENAGVRIEPLEGNFIEADLSSYKSTGIGSIRACNELERTGEIKFFANENDKELIYRSILGNECSLLPSNFTTKIGNVLSSECAMLYASSTCTSRRYDFYSLKIDPNKPINLQMYEEFKSDLGLSAYRRCTSTEGGEKAKITFSKIKNHKKHALTFVAGDLSSCTNFPSNFSAKSVENHGTCLELYHERGCRHWGKTVLGGHTHASQYLRKSRPNFKAREDFPRFLSFKLCQTFPFWTYKIKVTAFKIQVKTNFSGEYLEGEGQMVKLGADEFFLNNGGGNISKDYVASGTITESVRVYKIASVSGAMHPFTIEIFNQAGSEIPSLLKAKISAALMSSYTFQQSSPDSRENDVVITTEEREFVDSQKVQVPPCTVYSVGVSVRVANLSMEYDVFTQVSGTLRGGERMSAGLLQDLLPTDLEYVRKLDDFTVVANGKGHIVARHGFKPSFFAAGIPVQDCKLKSC